MAKPTAQPSPEAAALVRKHTYASVAAALVPIPLVDLGLLGAIQFRMVRQLARHYGVEMSEQRTKTILGSLLGLSLTASMGTVLRSFLPGGARLLLGIGALTIPAATTYGLGQVFAKHFESGGTIWTFDPERAKKDFEAEVAAGKRIVEDFVGVKP